jgi:hypothetical protein
MPSTFTRGSTTGSLRRFKAVMWGVSAWNGQLPVVISYITTPRA